MESNQRLRNFFVFRATVFVIIVALGLLGYGIWYLYKTQIVKPQDVACTMEAKLCPDGSAIGRSGPNCEFTACPIN